MRCWFLGQNTQVADLTGTRLIDHCVCGKVIGETFDAYFGGRKITYSLSGLASGVAGRTTGVALSGANAAGGEYAVTYGYDAYGRFNQVAGGGSGGFAFTYHYATPNSNLVSSLTQTIGGPAQTMTTAFAYEANRDLLAAITATYASTSKAAFAYGHDALGRRTSVVQSGEMFARYQNGGLMTRWTYNDRSEVTESKSYYGANINDLSQPVAARQLTYAFDNIGSRTTTGVDGVTTTYANNALNQLTARTAPASAWITGLAPTAATVSINSSSAGVTRQGEYYAKNVAATGTPPLWQSLTVSSTLSPGFDYVRGLLQPASPETYVYDLDGNLLSDGQWTYTWDAENRLTSIYPLAAIETLLPAASRRKVDFRYDYLGRRVRKTVQTWNGSAYVTSVDRKFIYDGWNLLTERDAATLSVVANYVWGLDLSKTLQDGGGVGGLLAVLEPNGTTHLTAYDGNGNVAALIHKTTGALTAAYEYDAFGQTIRATGTMSAANPFRFSTKYTDAETGLLYYGRRYYNPTLGRWLGRDPIEEKGGLHLYGFVGNNGVNKWDILGMCPPGYTQGTDGNCLQNFVVASTPLGRMPEYRNPYAGTAGDYGDSMASQQWDEDQNFNSLTPEEQAAIVAERNAYAKKMMDIAERRSICAGLGARLDQARRIMATNQNLFASGGQYTSVMSGLSDAERAILGTTSTGTSPNSSLNPIDNLSMAATAGGLATSVWQLQTGMRPTQTSTSLPLGATYFPNNVGLARVVQGVNLGVGVAATTISAAQLIDSIQTGDRAGIMLNGANVVYGFAGFAPGVGIVFSGASFVVNGSLWAYQRSADAADYRNTLASARSSIATINTAQNTINSLTQEMTDKGCND